VQLTIQAIPGPGEPLVRQEPDLRTPTWPPAAAPWPAPEALPNTRRTHRLGRAPQVLALLHAPAGAAPLRLDGLEVQPPVEWRTFATPLGPVAVVCNRSPEARTVRVPGFPTPVTLAPWQARVLAPGEN